jgi:2-succinyl-5-enolpyruvyl-6-hydroxy-3-cyclohexene-1-carboxylate synthase
VDEATAAATFCATLVDEWARCGVTDAVIAPGSRSTPMTVALARDERIRLHVHIDERAAGFLALGLGLASGRPAIVVTTSGTAAVELHPAVVEADLAGVPLLAVTTDRPPELHGVGAPQTVDQTNLYGRAVRSFVDPGVPRTDAVWSWRSLAARAFLDATDGPVHLNLAFTEPLLADPSGLPEGRPDRSPWHQAPDPVVPTTAIEALTGKQGVIVAGRGAQRAMVTPLAEALGWPVLADPLGHCTGVAGFDLLARTPWAETHTPEAVVWVGARPASKALAAWLKDVELQVVVDPTGAFVDPDRTATTYVSGLVAQDVPVAAEWASSWRGADDRVQAVLDDQLTDLTDPAVARTVVRNLAVDRTLVVASSMPIRDVEWFGGPTEARVLANRGANGIDGVMSTAVGVALTGVPTVALVGDLAFLHDTNALLGASERGVSLTVVVVDNDGGAIFSFLPQATQLDPTEFERLFGTPHGLDLVDVARAHGADAARIESFSELASAVQDTSPGVRVRVVKTDRHSNVATHEAIYDAVAKALTA